MKEIEIRYEPDRRKRDLPAWLREAAEEIRKAHSILDDAGVPRGFEEGIDMTLAARVAWALGERP